MAAIDFPNSPTNGQVFTSGDQSWTYMTGVGWLMNNGTSGSTDEVFVGPAQPTDPNIELWFDTDADDVTQVQAWNSAWGVIAVGPTAAARATAPNTNTRLGADLTFTTVANRRYRLSRRINSLIPSTTNFGIALAFLKGASVMGDGDQWMWSGGNYSGGIVQTDFVGDGTTITVFSAILSVNAGAGAYVDVNGAQIFCEDIGPVDFAVPAPVNPTIMQWNAAWGVVAVGSMKPSGSMASNTLTSMVTVPISFTPIAGRRYAVRGRIRAMIGTSGAALPYGYAMLYRDAVSLADIYFVGGGANAYCAVVADTYVNGDGVAHTWDFRVEARGAAVSYYPDTAGSFFIIEDVGPVSGSVAVVDPTPPWIYPTLTAPWANLGGTGSTWTQIRYRKIGDMVYLEGAPTGGSAQSSQIYVLPEGYRPTKRKIFGTVGDAGVGRIDVEVNGIVYGQSGWVLNTGWLSMDGMQFSVTS